MVFVLAAGAFAAGIRATPSEASRPKGSLSWARGCAAVAASLMLGCGGSGGGGGGGGPHPTATTLSIQQSGTQLRVTASVHAGGATPTGTISLVVDGGAPMMAGVSSGVAIFSFAPNPAGGFHTLDASYSRDANKEASDSGQQTTVVTGGTTTEVSGTSGTISTLTSLTVTLN